AGDELMRGVAVAMLAPTLGEHVFLLRLQHREPADLFEIAGEAGFGRQNRQGCGTGHSSALLKVSPRLTGRPRPTAAPRADGAVPAMKPDRRCEITGQTQAKGRSSASRRRDPGVSG